MRVKALKEEEADSYLWGGNRRRRDSHGRHRSRRRGWGRGGHDKVFDVAA